MMRMFVSNVYGLLFGMIVYGGFVIIVVEII